MQRTLTQETPDKKGETVTIKGWVDGRRDHGKIIFIDLRDRTGLVQVVFTPAGGEVYDLANQLRDEWVVEIKGVVAKRPENMRNPELATGEIELQASELRVLNQSQTPPFPIHGDGREIEEELRLKYRYLDLRRSRLQKNLRLRHEIILFLRNYLTKAGFVEVETPILTKGTPEGAREYVVPSRIYPGNFYVLPQSPQQYKQLLMVAGLEKYFQIARCFRDEDQRGDRQPEFTQLDLEMSFVTQEDVLKLGEELMSALVSAVMPHKKISQMPWPRLTYKEAMDKFGTDKPDLRRDKNDPDELAFCWIHDFPMFEKNEDGEIQTVHHPFTRPHPEDEARLEPDPLGVRALAYDIVLNGYEISSGSIRVHERALQNRIFKMLGLSDEEIQLKFGHMLEAFAYGAPPHGGFAPGLDRIIMILAGEPNIPEVIAFPKTGNARDPMMGSPAPLNPKQLKELHLKTEKKIEK
ncbi:MAG: aspartate--tRNA ligase [Candidatus Sungbacteria bacterium]|nr:aspartate--tRNA ligase [Candidatus Sungbacteria bacterium]